MRLAVVIPTMREGQLEQCLGPLLEHAVTSPDVCIVWNGLSPIDTGHPTTLHTMLLGNVGPFMAMQRGYEALRDCEGGMPDVVLLMHDDCIIRERGWDERLLAEFNVCTRCGVPHQHHGDPVFWNVNMPGIHDFVNSVGVVGFGGALGLGTDDLYKRPYVMAQLQRVGYRSNQDDAEIHGERFTGSCNVATLDGFAMALRRELLEQMDGLPVDIWPYHHHYDHITCLEAQRRGWRVRMVGVKCWHMGGQSVTTESYQRWAASTPYGSDAAMHEAGHPLIYERYRDMLPLRVTP